MWSESLEKELVDKHISGIEFEVVQSGDIDKWSQLIETERPDVVLLDVYWHEHARQKWGDVNRAADISLDALKQIRRTYERLPVIQYTLKPDKELMDQSYAAGATFFLEKVPQAIAEVHCALKYIMIYLLRGTK
jgi:DNA-binding NarL/FixJ family response regulator